jgi:glycosyltransferase involved in cell wall biosynthesis
MKAFNGNFIQKHALCVSSVCNVALIYVTADDQKESNVMIENSEKGFFELIVYYKRHKGNIPLVSAGIKYYKRKRAFIKGYHYLLKNWGKPDLVHLNVFYPAGVFAKYLKKKYGIPFLVTEHWTKFLPLSKEHFSFLEEYIIKSINAEASFICPVSENLKNEMIRFGLNNTYSVIPNVVNPTVFYPSQNEEFQPALRFLHVSHLEDRHKNISGLVRTFKKLSLLRSDFSLTIIGNRNVEETRKTASALKFPEGMVSIQDSKSESEIAECMRSSDVFVLFSNYENLPCVISEALMTGLPVISTNVGGIAEMLDETNGVLIHPGDEEALLKNLNQMITKHGNYDKKSISERAKKMYGCEEVAHQYLEVYEKILNDIGC